MRHIAFVTDDGPSDVDKNGSIIRDVDTRDFIACAFDHHGNCRRYCAAFCVEVPSMLVRCLRLPGDNIIGCLKDDGS